MYPLRLIPADRTLLRYQARAAVHSIMLRTDSYHPRWLISSQSSTSTTVAGRLRLICQRGWSAHRVCLVQQSISMNDGDLLLCCHSRKHEVLSRCNRIVDGHSSQRLMKARKKKSYRRTSNGLTVRAPTSARGMQSWIKSLCSNRASEDSRFSTRSGENILSYGIGSWFWHHLGASENPFLSIIWTAASSIVNAFRPDTFSFDHLRSSSILPSFELQSWHWSLQLLNWSWSKL